MILIFGLLAVGFQFFDHFVSSVYYYLIPDVVPTQFIGRFIGLFRIVGAGAGIVFHYEVAPLTSDMRTLSTFLDTLDPLDNQKGGTDVGAVLERALSLFDGRSGAHEVVVLLTDGEDLGGQGAAVARRAAERGIRVHVCGIGTEGGGKSPEGRGFVRDCEGKEVVSRRDAATLRAIAQVSGGDYVGTETSPTPLEELWTARIARMEGREYGSGRERIPHDRYQWPLVLAALCVCVESGLRGRRSAA